MTMPPPLGHRVPVGAAAFMCRAHHPEREGVVCELHSNHEGLHAAVVDEDTPARRIVTWESTSVCASRT